MYTLILTMYTGSGCCVHHIPGFEDYYAALKAAESWEIGHPARSAVIIKMKT
jgi:hypothetical protein